MIFYLKNYIVDFILILSKLYFNLCSFNKGKMLIWKYVHRIKSDQIMQIPSGFMLKIQTRDLICNFIYFFEIWEPILTKFLSSRFQDFDDRIFVDIGANIGYYSLLSTCLISHGYTISAEPVPHLYERLKDNISLNNSINIRAENVAILDSDTTITMYNGHCLNEGSSSIHKNENSTHSHKVSTKCISQLIHDDEVAKVKIIKIDTEGSEYLILQGIFKILHKFPDDIEIIVEINPK